jgi:hypothetical protein
MNNLLTRLLDFIEQQEKFYFRMIIVVLIFVLFLAAERFQDMVLFVSIGLLVGALYNRWQGSQIEIGAFVGACLGFLLYGVYFLVSGIVSLL